MKMYGVSLTGLSADEKEALFAELDRFSFMPPQMIIGSASGLLEAVIVFWDASIPFPGDIKLRKECHWGEIPAGCQDDFRANF